MSRWIDSVATYIKLRKCPVCGQDFVCYCSERDWAYHLYGQRDSEIVCSYHCARESEKQVQTRNRNSAQRIVAKPRKYKAPVIADDVPNYIRALWEWQVAHELTTEALCEDLALSVWSVRRFYNGTKTPSASSERLIRLFLEDKK